MRRFSRGCARITTAFTGRGPQEIARTRVLRKRCYESHVRPVPGQLQAIEKRLEYRLFPENAPENVRGLRDALQSIAVRLRAMEQAHARLAQSSTEWSEAFVSLASEFRERLVRLFEKARG